MSRHYITEASDGTSRIWAQGDSLATDKELTARDLAAMPTEELKALASDYWASRLGSMAEKGAGSPFFRKA